MEKKCLLLSTFSTFQAPLTLLTNSALVLLVLISVVVEDMTIMFVVIVWINHKVPACQKVKGERHKV